MLTLRQLEFVVAVAEEGSFTAAASRCHTVQSALSHQIAKLERALGVRVFDRSRKRVRTTAAGQVLLDNARDTLRAAQRLQDEVAGAAGSVRGRIQIGQISLLATVQVPRLLAAFGQAHRAVDVHLRTGMSDALLRDLAEGTLDVALIGVGPQVQLPPQHLLLHEERLSLIVAPGHRLAGRARVHLRELDGVPMAGLVQGAGVRDIVDAAFAAAGLRLHMQYEASHAELIHQLVVAGLGVAIVPDTISATLREIVVVPLQPRLRLLTYACWSADPTPAARAFIALLRAYLG